MVAVDRRQSDPAVLGGARVVASCLVVHPEWRVGPTDGKQPARETSHVPATVVVGGTRAGVLHLAGPAVEIVGLGRSVGGVLAAFGELADRMAGAAPSTAAALAGYVARSG